MRLVWLWGIVHVLICSRAVPAAAPVEATFASAEELSHTFSQTYTNTQDAVDVAVRLLHSLVADAPDTGECGLAWDILGPTKFICDTREMRESSSLSLVQRLRLLVASSFDKIINKHPKRPRAAHTLYDSPPVRLWPDSDVNKEKARLFDDWHGEPYLQYRPWPIINGWEQAMWGPFVGPIHDARAPFIEHMEENITNAYTNKALIEFMLGSRSQYTEHQAPMPALLAIRTRAIQLLEWVAYPPDDDTSVDAMLRASFAFSNETSRAQADALWILGEHYFWGTHGAAPNMTKAYQAYERLARTGNATAHSRLGYMHSSPFLAKVHGFEGSPTEAILHYTIASQKGDWHASNAMAYRLRYAIDVPENCTQSLELYDQLAQQTYKMFLDVPPFGRRLPYSKVRLTDRRWFLTTWLHFVSERYEKSLSKHSIPHPLGEHINEIVRSLVDRDLLQDLIRFWAIDDGENPLSQYKLARMHYYGSTVVESEAQGAVIPSADLAFDRALHLAKKRWPQGIHLRHVDEEVSDFDLTPNNDNSKQLAFAARSAAQMLGEMYLRGEHHPQDIIKAKVWLARANADGDLLSSTYLGMMYMYGYGGMAPNTTRGMELFEKNSHTSDLAALEMGKHELRTYKHLESLTQVTTTRKVLTVCLRAHATKVLV